jgi:hypothetical protein
VGRGAQRFELAADECLEPAAANRVFEPNIFGDASGIYLIRNKASQQLKSSD